VKHPVYTCNFIIDIYFRHYSLAEKIAIVKFVVDHDAYDLVKGRNLRRRSYKTLETIQLLNSIYITIVSWYRHTSVPVPLPLLKQVLKVQILIFHLTNDAALLECGCITSDLYLVRSPSSVV
jgi:hypothetical protein